MASGRHLLEGLCRPVLPFLFLFLFCSHVGSARGRAGTFAAVGGGEGRSGDDRRDGGESESEGDGGHGGIACEDRGDGASDGMVSVVLKICLVVDGSGITSDPH